MHITLRGVTKRFGEVLANDRISLDIAAGSIHGLLGENGAGKSTLVKMLSGFLVRDAGELMLGGAPAAIATPIDAIRAGIGMLHQDPLDFPPMTVLENFMAGRGQGFWLDIRHHSAALLELCERFGFQLDPNETLHNLSVGERQQLEIVRLLSLGVRVLILDEPTTGISANQKESLFAALQQLATEGTSIIFVSHKLEDVQVLCDRVSVMRQGRMVGHAEIPCADSALVELMFGAELAEASKPHTARSETRLSVRNLSVSTDRLQLDLKALQVRSGEVIGCAGLEGNGQQLLLLACAGLLSPQSGDIGLNGCDMAGVPYPRYQQAGVTYLPADRLLDGLVAGLSICDHMVLRTSNPGWFVNRAKALEKTQTAIATYNIRGQSHSLVESLSGGNQQRTQLALLPESLSLLLMEHPTRGLDIESALWVWQQLLARCRQGTSIVFASADLDEIVQYSDRVLVFSGGQVSEPIPAAELTADLLGQKIGGRLQI
ncbi:MAG: ATP-binding cassette domain-containing protein [Cyanobacteria bacterium P01_E01_bin.34]